MLLGEATDRAFGLEAVVFGFQGAVLSVWVGCCNDGHSRQQAALHAEREALVYVYRRGEVLKLRLYIMVERLGGSPGLCAY